MKQVKKTLVDQMVSFIEKSSCSNMEQEDSKKEKNSCESNLTPARNIVMIKKQKNIQKRVFNVLPNLQQNHIDKVFGVLFSLVKFVTINQQAVKNPKFEQSYLFSYLQCRTIERIEFFQHAIIFEMTQPDCRSDPPVEYLIEKYKSKGDVNFYEMALLIEQLTQLLKGMSPPLLQSQLIKKWLDLLGDQMFVGIFGPRKLVISKSLLSYLEYNIEELAVQAIKYHSLFLEIFSSSSYSVGIKHLLTCLKLSTQLNLGKISLQQYRDATTYHFCDFMHSRTHKTYYCEMKFYQLTPNHIVHSIEKIIYCEEEDRKSICSQQMKNAMEEEREHVKQAQYRMLNKIKPLPAGLFVQNKPKMADYILKDKNNKYTKQVEKS